MMASLRNLLLAALLLGLLHSNALAGDKPPPGIYVEVEIEYDTGKATPPPILDEATLKAFQKWRFKPKKVRRVKIPMMYLPIPLLSRVAQLSSNQSMKPTALFTVVP